MGLLAAGGLGAAGSLVGVLKGEGSACRGRECASPQHTRHLRAKVTAGLGY